MRRIFACLVLAPSLAYAQAPVEPPVEAVEPPPPPPQLSPREQCLEQRKALAEKAQATSDLNERTRLLRSLPNCGADPTTYTPPPTTTVEVEAPDNIATGFIVEARLDAAYSVTGDAFVPLSTPGLFLGYRGAAFSAGAGFEIARVAQSMEGNGMQTHANQTALLFVPGVRFRLARTHEGDTELLGTVDIGIGSSWTDDSDSTDDPASPLRLRLQFGLSPRHWFTRSFAIGAAIGVRYDAAFVSTEINNMSFESSASGLALFSSLETLAVF